MYKKEPYLWIHVAGLAILPLWLELVWLGLAAGKPILPVMVELGMVALVGTVPILLMQWTRPFDIFSILLLSLQPDQLNDKQRQILKVFKTPKHRVLTGLGAIALLVALWFIARYSPLVATTTPFPNHAVGLLVAAIAFLASNLFLQVPLSVIAVFLTRDTELENFTPDPPEQITSNYLVPGVRVKKILPPLVEEQEKSVSTE
ncbi:MAG: low-complexity tail membrane protein [Halothece sp.]